MLNSQIILISSLVSDQIPGYKQRIGSLFFFFFSFRDKENTKMFQPLHTPLSDYMHQNRYSILKQIVS